MEPPVLMTAVPARLFGHEVERSAKWLLLVLGALVAYVLVASVVISAVEILPPPAGSPQDAAPVHWPFSHAAYFTITNVTGVGFGDVVPRTATGRAIAAANSAVGFLLFAAIVAALVLALSPGEFRRPGEHASEKPEAPREPLGNDDALALALSGLGYILRESAVADAERPRGAPTGEWRERSFAYVISDRQEIEIIVRSR